MVPFYKRRREAVPVFPVVVPLIFLTDISFEFPDSSINIVLDLDLKDKYRYK